MCVARTGWEDWVFTARGEGRGDGEGGALAKKLVVGGWWLLADWRSVAVQMFAKRCALRAHGMGRMGLLLRAERGGGMERAGRLRIQVAGNW